MTKFFINLIIGNIRYNLNSNNILDGIINSKIYINNKCFYFSLSLGLILIGIY
jgi:hypothetical protein